MSTTYPDVDQAAANLIPQAARLLDGASRQQSSGLPAYVGLHRRCDGQGQSPDEASRPPAHRARHRRGR